MSKIAFLGTSLTKAIDYGNVQPNQCFAYLIGIASGYAPEDIINAGKSSDTSAGMLARLQTDIISKQPRVCVYEGVLNDWSTGVPIDQFRSNVHETFAALQANGIKIAVINSGCKRGSTQEFKTAQPYLLGLEDEAAFFRVPVIDLYRELLTAYAYLTSTEFNALYVDTAHLTVAGHQFAANLAMRDKYTGAFL